ACQLASGCPKQRSTYFVGVANDAVARDLEVRGRETFGEVGGHDGASNGSKGERCAWMRDRTSPRTRSKRAEPGVSSNNGASERVASQTAESQRAIHCRRTLAFSGRSAISSSTNARDHCPCQTQSSCSENSILARTMSPASLARWAKL